MGTKARRLSGRELDTVLNGGVLIVALEGVKSGSLLPHPQAGKEGLKASFPALKL